MSGCRRWPFLPAKNVAWCAMRRDGINAFCFLSASDSKLSTDDGIRCMSNSDAHTGNPWIKRASLNNGPEKGELGIRKICLYICVAVPQVLKQIQR